MNIGFIGLGKLGLPVAVAIAEAGHTVYGYDIRKEALSSYEKGISNLYEPNMDERLHAAMPPLHFVTEIEDAVLPAELVFIAVQTPHAPEMDGSIRFNHVRKDFDYQYLLEAAKQVAGVLKYHPHPTTVAVISTVLPGTTQGVIHPAMEEIIGRRHGDRWALCYNPSFIAMGQTISDFANPEFTLIGSPFSNFTLSYLYKTLHDSPILQMSWEEAELVKVLYNTFIGFKIIFANMVMQICHKEGANCDMVTNALCQATQRILSPQYLRGGMSDGGSCHPRDNIAMSHYSDEIGLSYNIFDFIMTIREAQTEWLADLMMEHNLPKVILGRTYKPGTDLTAGSPSELLADILRERGEEATFYDPVTDPAIELNPSVYLIATMWDEFHNFPFPPGSVVIDPWGMLEQVPEEVTLVSVGRTK